ncbi:hypothetical protein HPB47_013982 [Ixodes persulcatus]|uniref:Uncharacterized protein n=1 Tax=Ixodes persulcatus TaxID=34615 RepID=A0AC60QY81_IXOPE|nr:hypothetical protein HPB47_013982 [Ixodes persulcatus]
MVDVVDLIGNFGRWQGFFVAFVTYRGILTGLNNMAYVFLVTNNDHWCSYPDKDGNMTSEQLKKMFIPYDNVSESYSQCLMYDVPLNGTTGVDNATTILCNSWIYDEHAFGHSVSNEWDLVCERKWQKSLVQSSYMGCLMLGVIIIGNLSDRYGRRIVAVWSSILLALSSVACVFSNSFYFFLAARVGIAFGISGLQVASFSLLAETIGPKSRIALNICYGYGWIAGILLLPGIVWLVEDWRKLYIVNSVLGVSILVMLPWLYESPRWLLSTGQKTKACQSIKKIAKFNRRGPQDIEKEVERLMETKVGVLRGKVSTAELFKTKYLRRNTILLTSCSFFSYIVYYGFARSSTTLGGNPFITFAITAAIETVGYTMSLGTTKYLKRIPIMAGSYGFFGVTLVATALTPKAAAHTTGQLSRDILLSVSDFRPPSLPQAIATPQLTDWLLRLWKSRPESAPPAKPEQYMHHKAMPTVLKHPEDRLLHTPTTSAISVHVRVRVLQRAPTKVQAERFSRGNLPQ